MTESPYSTPKSKFQVDDPIEAVKIYSPAQVACGTIGGPVGLIYFLMSNFYALGKHDYARNTKYYGIVFIVVLIAIIPFFPDRFPSGAITGLYIFTALHISKKYQLTKSQIQMSSKYQFQSNWRVLGVGLVCLLASSVVIFVPIYMFVVLGFIDA